MEPVNSRGQDAHVPVKRKAVRKGTHSCWECKRRKLKCVVDPLSDPPTCRGCRKRGSACISQEFPDSSSLPTDSSSTAPYSVRATEYFNNGTSCGQPWDARRVAIPGREGTGIESHPLTPSSTLSDSSRQLAFYQTPEVRPSPDCIASVLVTDDLHQRTCSAENGRLRDDSDTTSSPHGHDKLSRSLHGSLPSREDTERIWKACPRPGVLAYEIMTMPYNTLAERDPDHNADFLRTPEPDQHPVLIARYMLRLASFLQNLQSDLHPEIRGLSEPAHSMSSRLRHVATSLVTSNDEFMGSIESLECLIIHCVYLANLGHLRRSWVAARRVLTVAQLMGLHRSRHEARYRCLDPETTYHPSVMWFRIVFLDRLLSLMLGLPQGCADRRMRSDAMLTTDLLIERLERIHYVVTSRILERNDCDGLSRDSDLARTLELDRELQTAARMLPSKWWLPPQLNGSRVDLFWSTRRLFAQVLHYSLLNQLHLPYMLRSFSSRDGNDYSRITCVNASREILSRFIALRSFNTLASGCRLVDFLALMAALTLILAYLDFHPSEPGNSLAHQYQSDRAMIEMVQENMKEVNRVSADPLSAHSARLLERLLAIAVDDNDVYSNSDARRVSVHDAEDRSTAQNSDDGTAVSVHIPYFGIIRIARQGVRVQTPFANDGTSVEGSGRVRQDHRAVVDGMQESLGSSASNTCAPSTVRVQGSNQASIFDPTGLHGPAAFREPYTKDPASVTALPADSAMTDYPSYQHQSLANAYMQQNMYPGPAAIGEEWAFQGVESAFFDSLMRGIDDAGRLLGWNIPGDGNMMS